MMFLSSLTWFGL